MKSKTPVIDFKTSGYFSGLIIFLGFFLLLVAALVISKSVIGAAVCVLVSFVIFTTHYRLRIDPANNKYHDYLWFLGLKFGERGRFDAIEYVYLKPSKVRQTMHVRASSSTISKVVVDVYVRLSPENKIHLFTRDSRHDAVVKAKEVADRLKVGVVDYTAPETSEA